MIDVARLILSLCIYLLVLLNNAKLEVNRRKGFLHRAQETPSAAVYFQYLATATSKHNMVAYIIEVILEFQFR